MIRLSRDSVWQADKYFTMYVKVYVILQKKKEKMKNKKEERRQNLFEYSSQGVVFNLSNESRRTRPYDPPIFIIRTLLNELQRSSLVCS